MKDHRSFRERIFKNLTCLYCPERFLSMYFIDEENGNEKGLLFCPDCGRWYPIDGGIIEILPDEKIDWTFRRDFWKIVQEKGLDKKVPVTFDSSFGEADSLGGHGFSDEMVEVYDSVAVQTHFWKRVEEYFISKWVLALRTIKDRGIVLEAACGSGRMTEKFASLGFNIVGLDVTFKMIKKAQEIARRRRITDNIVYIVADAERMPFPKSMFNACIFCGFLHHLNDPNKALTEISRTLVSGGMVYGMDNHRSSVRWAFDLLMKVHPLWKEEGGTHQTISIPLLYKWGDLAKLKFKADTFCFVPPHLYDLIGQSKADKIFDWTNKVFPQNRYLKKLGGLLDIEGVRKWTS